MLTTLSTLKSRLGILESDTQYDAILTNAIKAVSARFDKETRRSLARQVDATHEFDPDDSEILLTRYPVESVSKFELKKENGCVPVSMVSRSLMTHANLRNRRRVRGVLAVQRKGRDRPT